MHSLFASSIFVLFNSDEGNKTHNRQVIIKSEDFSSI